MAGTERETAHPVEPSPGSPGSDTAAEKAGRDRAASKETEPDPRFTLANERTFLAWIRTALALIAGGLAVSQLVKRGSSGVTLAASLALIVFGALVCLLGYLHWRRNEAALRAQRPIDPSREARVLVYGIAGFAVAAIALAVIRLT